MKKAVIILVSLPRDEEEIYNLKKKTDELCGFSDYYLYPVFLDKNEWNEMLVPWDHNDHSSERCHTSGKAHAAGFLSDIIAVVIPEICTEYQLERTEAKFIISGYSLGGLFSIWSMYQDPGRRFSAAVSCSGSLWYPGFKDFIIDNSVKTQCSIYMSLGEKEARTKNPVMKTVKKATKEIYEHLQNDPSVNNIILEFNPGGHFTDVDDRLAKGMAWALKKM